MTGNALPATMAALRLHGPDALSIDEVPLPAVTADTVLIATRAATICTSDLQDIAHNDFGIQVPITIGHEAAGVIVATGSGVTRVRIGDRVAAHPVHPCRRCETCVSGREHLCPHMEHFGIDLPGSFAPYLLVRQDRVRVLPEGVPFTVGALAEPVSVCLEALAQAHAQTGGSLLLIGDGPFACIMARLAVGRGLAVTAVGRHLERLARMGQADTVLTTSRDALPHLGHRQFDAIILTVPNPALVNPALSLLRPQGRLVLFAPMPGNTPVDLFQVLVRELEIVGAVNDQDRFDDAIAALADPALALGNLVTHTFPLARYVEALHAAGHDRAHAMKVAFIWPDPAASLPGEQ